MKISEINNIITLHLRDMSVREISSKTGRARSTVEDVIEKWRRGEFPVMREELNYESTILEIASYLRKNGLKVADIAHQFLNLTVVRSESYDLDDLLHLYNLLGEEGITMLPEIVKTVAELKNRKINFSELAIESERLEGVKAKLEDRIEELNEQIRQMEKRESDIKKNIDDLNSVKEEKTKEERSLTKFINDEQSRIEKSDTFWKLANQINLQPDAVLLFMKKARDLSYDAGMIAELRTLDDFGLQIGVSRKDLGKTHILLQNLMEKGWDPAQITKLLYALHGVTEKPEEVINIMRDYSLRKDYVEKKIEELNAALSNLEKTRSIEEEKLNTKLEEKNSELREIDEKISEGNRKRKEIEDAIAERVRDFNGEMEFINAAKMALDAIKTLEAKKKELEDEIRKLEAERKASKSQIDLANALVSVIRSPEGRVTEILRRLIDALKNEEAKDWPSLDAPFIRDLVINALIEITKDGIAEISNLNGTSFMTKARYDELTNLEQEKFKIESERADLDNIRSSFGRDIASFLDDYTNGKMPVRNNMDAFLKKIIETKIEETVRMNFTTRNIISLMKDRYQEGEPFIFVTSASSPSAPVLGRLYPDTLAESVHTGAEILYLTDKNGNRVTIALCSALKQLFEQLVDMHTVEQLRRVWRNLIASENAKKDMGTSSA